MGWIKQGISRIEEAFFGPKEPKPAQQQASRFPDSVVRSPVPQPDPRLLPMNPTGRISPLEAAQTPMADSIAMAMGVSTPRWREATQEKLDAVNLPESTMGFVLHPGHSQNPDKDIPAVWMNPSSRFYPQDAQGSVSHELFHMLQYDSDNPRFDRNMRELPENLEGPAQIASDAIQFIRRAGIHGNPETLQGALQHYKLRYDGGGMSLRGDPEEHPWILDRLKEEIRKYGSREPYKGNKLIQQALEGL